MKTQAAQPQPRPQPLPDPDPIESGVWFGVQQDRRGFIPVKLIRGQVYPLADPMPYQALAYQILLSAVQAHYAELSRQ